ncbi:MAG: DHA1 family tetracycline resistance protein-like MFS transporter [Crocinitomicaceae bacterium]|jgi:DHA1 family tetracycline resistance protein-like MFS transporter
MSKKLLPAYLLTFVNVLGFSILMPILPFVVESHGAPEWVFGLLLSCYSAFQFIGAPYLGSLSDSIGRKPVLLISQAGTLLSWFIFMIALAVPELSFLGLALPLWIIGLSRVLDGLTGGNTSVANAYVSDVTTRDEKAYIFGYLGGIAGLGLIIGPGLGGLTASSSLGYFGTLITAAVISTITLITIIAFLKESHPPEKRVPRKRQSLLKSMFILRRIREVKPSPVVKTILSVKLFFSIMMAFYMSTISLYLIDSFDFDESELGFFMLIVGVFLAFNQAFLSKQFIKRFGEYPTLLLGLGFCILGMFCITLSNNLYVFIGFYYFLNLGLSLCFPTFNALLSIHASPEKQGSIMGISESISSFALAVFPVVGAALFGFMGFKVYYIAVILPIIALVLAIIAIRKLGRKAFE